MEPILTDVINYFVLHRKMVVIGQGIICYCENQDLLITFNYGFSLRPWAI